MLVIDEGSLASTVQARDLLRIASELRVPKLVLVGDAKQLEAVDAGKPFAQLQQAGMKTAVMDEILRQREPGPEGRRRGEPRERYRQGVRKARIQCRRGKGPTTSPERSPRAGSRSLRRSARVPG